MNFKRKKRKNARAGCLLCKPHKANGAKEKEKPSVKRRVQVDGKSIEITEASAADLSKLREAYERVRVQIVEAASRSHVYLKAKP